MKRISRGDPWTRAYGSIIPVGAVVDVIRFMPRRRVLVLWEGREINTPLWCLKKEAA